MGFQASTHSTGSEIHTETRWEQIRESEKSDFTRRSNKRKVDSENKAYSRRRYVDGSSSKLHLATEKKTTIQVF